MTQNLSYNQEDLFQQIIKSGRQQAATTRESYHDIIDEVIEDHRELGEINDDNPTIDMREQLRGRWGDYEIALGLNSDTPQL